VLTDLTSQPVAPENGQCQFDDLRCCSGRPKRVSPAWIDRHTRAPELLMRLDYCDGRLHNSRPRAERAPVDMTAVFALVAAAACETGLVRQNNEDAAYSGRCLFAVADGMGGHAAGEVASAAVIESLRAHDEDVSVGALLKVLHHAVTEANAEVARRAADDPARFGMGTTLTAMLWSGDTAALAHIGDSRAFRLRDGQLRQLTEDHVLGNLVSNAGSLAPVLSRYLDGRPDRSPDLGLRDVRLGDRYLICSDGLSPVVGDEEIAAVLAAAADPADAVHQLVALAEEAGGPDNISAIVIDVLSADSDSDHIEPITLGAAAAVATR
jgi:PPM family protein phosphatase